MKVLSDYTQPRLRQSFCEIHGEFEEKCFGEIRLGCPLCSQEISEKRKKMEEEDEKRKEDYKKRELEKEKISKVELSNYSTPPLYREASFDNFLIKYRDNKDELEKAKKNLDIARKYVAGVVENRTNSLVISGDYGIGKTYMACAIANELRANKIEVIFREAGKITKAIDKSKRFNQDDDELSVINEFVNYEYLIIDDLGSTFAEKNEMLNLSLIIKERYNNKKRTMILSNLDKTAFENYVSQMLYRRLTEKGFFWEYK